MEVPVGLQPEGRFVFGEQVMTLGLNASRRALHFVADDDVTCAMQEPNLRFTDCSANASSVPYRHVAVGQAHCNGNTLTFLASETENHRLVRVQLHAPADVVAGCTNNVTSVAGISGSAGNGEAAPMASAQAIRAPSGAGQSADCSIFFADTGNGRVQQVTPEGALINVLDVPGLKSLAVHPTLGVAAFTQNAVYLITPR